MSANIMSAFAISANIMSAIAMSAIIMSAFAMSAIAMSSKIMASQRFIIIIHVNIYYFAAVFINVDVILIFYVTNTYYLHVGKGVSP